MKKWWECPKCKSYKMVEENCSCVRCPECGVFFDEKSNEISVNVSLYDLNPLDRKCDLN
ncbi:UNVERIFIED_CONTAM: hypothetical protein Cloal_3874 [Acetivibrio alkalicellulosi]